MRRVRSQSNKLSETQEKLEQIYNEMAGSGLEDYSLPISVCKSASSVFHHLLAQKSKSTDCKHLERDMSNYLKSRDYVDDQIKI